MPGERQRLGMVRTDARLERTDPAGDPRRCPPVDGQRLRVVADPATVDARFLLDEAKAQRIESVIAQAWPERIEPEEIGSEKLAKTVIEAREALLAVLSLDELA